MPSTPGTAGAPLHFLDTQYRMHPAIAAFPAAHFYAGRLRNAPDTLRPSSLAPWVRAVGASAPGPCASLDVSEGRAERRGTSSARSQGRSYRF